MERKQNIVVAALCIAGIALGFDLVLNLIPIGGMFSSLLYTHPYVVFLTIISIIWSIFMYVSMICAGLLFYKAISATKNMKVWPIFVMSILAVVIMEILNHVMPYEIAWNDNLILSRDYILLALDFIIMWGTMMLALLASGFNKRNTPVYTYQQPPVYQQTAPNYQQTAPTYQQPIYQQPTNYQQPPVYQQPPTTKNE